MNRVFLSGYYGMHNTGDDALLAVAAWGVRQFLAPDRIFVNVACPPEFPGAESLTPIYSPEQRFKYENRLRGYGAALMSKSVVYGGGSLFHTSSGIRSNINQLRLAGIVRPADGRLVVRNRIYERAFDREWIRANMPAARRPSCCRGSTRAP